MHNSLVHINGYVLDQRFLNWGPLESLWGVHKVMKENVFNSHEVDLFILVSGGGTVHAAFVYCSADRKFMF